MNGLKAKANAGMVVRAELRSLERFLSGVDALLRANDGVVLVHQTVSASRLWLVEEGHESYETEQTP